MKKTKTILAQWEECLLFKESHLAIYKNSSHQWFLVCLFVLVERINVSVLPVLQQSFSTPAVLSESHQKYRSLAHSLDL